MQANYPGVEFLKATKYPSSERDRKVRRHLLTPFIKRAVTAKKCEKKCTEGNGEFLFCLFNLLLYLAFLLPSSDLIVPSYAPARGIQPAL